MKQNKSAGGLVYSTETGRMCPACRQPVAACSCGSRTIPRAADGPARVARETKGRGGKTVTLVKGLPLDDAALTALAKQLKAACGSGGKGKDGVIEIQGDHCEQVLATLAKLNLAAKRTGG